MQAERRNNSSKREKKPKRVLEFRIEFCATAYEWQFVVCPFLQLVPFFCLCIYSVCGVIASMLHLWPWLLASDQSFNQLTQKKNT